MSYEFYKVLHIAGIFLLFFGLVGLTAIKIVLGPQAEIPKPARRLFFILHGVGLLLALVAGFGLAARLGFAANMPHWVWIKVGIWLLLGIGISIAKRKGHLGFKVLVAFWSLGVLAAWLAVNKPGM